MQCTFILHVLEHGKIFCALARCLNKYNEQKNIENTFRFHINVVVNVNISGNNGWLLMDHVVNYWKKLSPSLILFSAELSLSFDAKQAYSHFTSTLELLYGFCF